MIRCCLYVFLTFLLTSYSYIHAQTIQYTYDRAGRLIHVLYPDQSTIDYTYDKDGNRIAEIDTLCKQPQAAFSASKTTGPCPLFVDFFDNSTTTGQQVSYKWTFYLDSLGTNYSSTQQNPSSIQYNTHGSFLVQLMITDRCGSDTNIMSGYINVYCPPATVEGIQESDNVSVYPNPTTNIVTIQGNKLANGSYTIQLQNIAGQKINEFDIDIVDNQIHEQINIQELPNGVYILNLTTRENKWTFKITKK